MLGELLERAAGLRARLLEDGRRIEELVRAVGDEAWLAKVEGARMDAEAEERRRKRAGELVRIIDEEIERLSRHAAAGEEGEAS